MIRSVLWPWEVASFKIDPRPKKRDIKRRLSNNGFLSLYKKVLKPGGVFRLKTDNTNLFAFTLEEVQARNDIEEFHFTYDVYDSPMKDEVLDIKTRYELMFAQKGESIKYLKLIFKQD